jgi:RNA polymerase sigma factor (sigma-70 family)
MKRFRPGRRYLVEGKKDETRSCPSSVSNMWDDKTDAELMVGVAAGNSAMLGVLYCRHGRAVQKALRRWSPDVSTADVDDLVQEIFVALGASARNYREQSKFKAWLFTVAHRKAQDLHRSRVRRGELDMRDTDIGEMNGVACSDCEGLRAEMRDAIKRILSKLPDELREVLWLKAAEGFASGEIARIIGVGEVTVRTRLHRARQLLLASADAAQWKKLVAGGVG